MLSGVPQAPPVPPPLPPTPPPRHPRPPHHPCLLRQVRVQPTSSASLLLTNATPFHVSACGSRPIAEVLWQRPAGSEWQTAAQVGKHGEAFPLEICGAHCPAPLGCRIAVRLRNGVLLNATAAPLAATWKIAGDSGHRGTVGVQPAPPTPPPIASSPPLAGASGSPSTASTSSQVVFTPPPARAPVHVPGARLELLLKPPLWPVTVAAAAPLVEAMLAQLNDHYFVMRSHRIRLAELSSTGGFMMLDVIPEDIFACAQPFAQLPTRAIEFQLTVARLATSAPAPRGIPLPVPTPAPGPWASTREWWASSSSTTSSTFSSSSSFPCTPFASRVAAHRPIGARRAQDPPKAGLAS